MPNCDFYVFNPFEDFGAGLPARGYPQTLVRYTKAGDRFRDTCRGQVWFSRLAEFVGGPEHRFRDMGEARLVFTCDVVGPLDFDLNVQGLPPVRRGVEVEHVENVVYARIDGLGLCLSEGPYNREQHREILAHNPDLTHYVEFNTPPFLRAVWRQAEGEGLINETRGQEMTAAAVQYVDRPHYIRITRETGFVDGRALYNAQWTRSAYCKPPAYQHEREFRIVFNAVPNNVRGILLRSDEIAEAMVASGEFRP